MHSSGRNLALLLLIGLAAGLIALWLLGRGSAPDEAGDVRPPSVAADAPGTLAEPAANKVQGILPAAGAWQA